LALIEHRDAVPFQQRGSNPHAINTTAVKTAIESPRVCRRPGCLSDFRQDLLESLKVRPESNGTYLSF
ncbi:MAG: hypothetical protein O6932_11505, partial [Gammaproteobacteria bacterium]|nr:hypothetical protein [Gammaproteobacteria bacterium]